MENYRNLLDIIGDVSALIILVSVIAGFILWFVGILPVLLRLGNGLSRRKIAIFASGDSLVRLENLLNDCKLFRRKNILKITDEGDLGVVKDATIFLVYWPDWEEKIASSVKSVGDIGFR